MASPLESLCGYDRPAGDVHQSRSAVLARHAMVATSQPLATQVGLEVLRGGGNAVDAAIAANAMLTVVEPMSCGIGGDLFALYWDAASGRLYGLNASGRSPGGLTAQRIREAGHHEMPLHGPLSWSVPGCVSGWSALQERFGCRSLRENLQPAIATAREGFAVSQIIAADWAEAAALLRRWPDSAATYLMAGRAPVCGEVFRLPGLADTYEQLGDDAEATFYRGPIARCIAEFSRRHGGYLTEEDFAAHRAEWVEPVSTRFQGVDVWQLPPSGQGIAVLQMLNLLEAFPSDSWRPADAEYLHLLVEAKKLAYADRARYYADPTRVDVPTDQLICPSYARQRAALIDPTRAAATVEPGDPRLAIGDTVYLCVVDESRNCCSLIQSVYHAFGSHVTPGDVGFVMQNRGALFSLDERHANRLEPHKRPFHTIIPGMVTREGRPWFCYGVMGGDMQPQGQVQVLVNLLVFGLDVQAAGDAARVRHEGQASPRGTHTENSGLVLVESGIPDAAVAGLRRRGHHVRRAKGGYGGYQGVWIDWDRGVLHGASEVRKDGAAAGY